MKKADSLIPVKFFTRPGCHLCKKARELLRELEDRYPLEVEEINILRQRQYYEKYKHTIPVVIIGETRPLESIIERQEIAHRLAIAAAKHDQGLEGSVNDWWRGKDDEPKV
jgi:glutaredoxin